MAKKNLIKPLKLFMRELVFGMEDGLVSNLGIVFALWAAASTQKSILLAGLASLFAGALSMAAGSYLSSKSVKEVYDAEATKAKILIKDNPKKASSQMRKILKQEKFDANEINVIMKHFLKHNKKTFLINYLQKKLHLPKSGPSHPVHDAGIMFLAFCLGSFFPILPFFFGADSTIMLISATLTISTLFAVGAAKSQVSHKSYLASGLEMVVIGMGAGVLGYIVGHIFSLVV